MKGKRSYISRLSQQLSDANVLRGKDLINDNRQRGFLPFTHYISHVTSVPW